MRPDPRVRKRISSKGNLSYKNKATIVHPAYTYLAKILSVDDYQEEFEAVFPSGWFPAPGHTYPPNPNFITNTRLFPERHLQGRNLQVRNHVTVLSFG